MKQRYDSYKSSGIDWIGEIPSHWDISKIKFEGEIRGRIGFRGYTVSDLVEEGEGAYTIGGKHISKNVLDLSEPEYISWEKYYESPEIMVHKGDIVIAQRGTLKRCALIDSNISEATINPSLVLLTNIKINPKYLHYYLCSNATTEYIDYLNTATAVPMISQNQIENIRIALPPLAEQEAIAAWLDEKCGDIDAAIAKVDREIELIDELKQSEISRVVTRGLNPNVPFRPSGIDWIGEIPEHWEIVPLKSQGKFVKGLIFTKADLIDDGKPVISYGQIHSKSNDRIGLKSELMRFIPESLTHPNAKVKTGSFIFADTSEDLEGCGNAVYIDNSTEIYAGYHTIVFNAKNNWNAFLGYLFLTDAWRSQIRKSVSGVKVFSITQSIISSTSVILPPSSEQREIADYLDKKCAEIDCLKVKLKKKREALVELRQSLISEVVTGKRKVV